MGDQMRSVRSQLSGETWAARGTAGAAAGLVGGVAMGLVLQLGTELLPLIGRLAGSATLVRGWIVHLVTSALFGLVYAAFVSLPYVRDVATTVGANVILGVIHASALSYFTIGVVLPAATIVLGLPESPLSAILVPGPRAGGLVDAGFFGVGHVLYGMLLGAVYAVLRGYEIE